MLMEHLGQHSFVRNAIPEVLFFRHGGDDDDGQSWYHSRWAEDIPNIHMGTPIICIPATWKSP